MFNLEKPISEEKTTSQSTPIGNLPNSEKLPKNFPLLEAVPEIENLPMAKLDEKANDIVIFSLAFHHHWKLSHDGQLNSYVTNLENKYNQISVKMWSSKSPKQLRSHLRCLVWKTDGGVKHRYLFRFENRDMQQTSQDYASLIDLQIRKILELKTNELNDLTRSPTPMCAQATSCACLAHEVFS